MSDETRDRMQENVWKPIATFLAGALLSLTGMMIASSHDTIPRSEVDQKIHEVYQRMAEEHKAINEHLGATDRTVSEHDRDIARIGQRLGVPVGSGRDD